MSLNFILGKSQKDHEKQIVDQFLTDYQENPDDQYFFIVPNHIKFESEIKIIKQFRDKFKKGKDYVATSNLQIFSLSRLAWYFLRNINALIRPSLTTTKKSMIVKNILLQHIDELSIFKGEVRTNGFINELTSQFDEFIEGNIQPEDLENFINNSESNFEKQKFTELKLIYADYYQLNNQEYLSNEYLNDQLINLFNNKDFLKNTHFYFYGFSSFKNNEFALIKSIMLQSETNISLELDQPYIQLPEPTDFYYRPSRTYENLYKFARENNIPVNNNYAQVDRVANDLRKIEDFWIASNSLAKTISNDSLENKNTLQIWQCSDIHVEIKSVATYIRQLVATQEYRYKDFLILTRNLSSYQAFINPMFEELEVPIFLDIQKNMSKHPLKLLIDYIFAFAKGNLNHETIFQLLKLNLVTPTDISTNEYSDFIDLAENYSLAHGLLKYQWLEGQDFSPDVDLKNLKEPDQQKIINDFAKINNVKHFVKSLYEQLQAVLETAPAKEVVERLYNFLIDNQVFENLKTWQQISLDAGNIEDANKPEQVVLALNNVLDEFVEVFGEQTFDSQDFLKVLDSGFLNSQYTQIPSTLDAVNISELGMVQMNDRKITIILGSTSDQMPKSTTNDSLLSDEEKEKFAPLLKSGSNFSDSVEIINNDEPYLHNASFISSSTRTIFTYPVIADDAQAQISPYLQRLKDHFEIEERVVTNNPDVSNQHALEYVGSSKSTLNYLIRLNRQLKDYQGTLTPNWQSIQNIVLQSNEDEKLFNQALNYKNIPQNLSKQTVADLYGNTLNASISQLQTFYMNEYEYFLTYGLRLRQRDEFELTPANMGSFFHDCLDKFVSYINEHKLDLSQFDKQQVDELTNEIVQKNLEQPANQLFNSSPQMKYVAQQMKNILLGLTDSIQKQGSQLNFSPRQSELTFGSLKNQKEISSIAYQTGDKKINVRGKIDRLDNFSKNNTLQIIDYKSSAKSFDYSLFNAGIQLQLTTYMQAILNNYPEANLAGAFYSKIYSPRNNATYLGNKNYKDYRLKGLIINNEKNQELLTADGLDEKNSSDIYNLRLKKDGTISSTEQINESELKELLKYNKELIIQAGEKILSGEINLNPYRKNDQQTALQNTNYKSIFEFDAMLPENNYREIKSITKKELLNQLTAKEEDKNV
ncbi:PD-(D/E)XK nuclease family protein [Lactobacillus sp. YT155]|uniref:PD-(D/E)XK nuclease family protein n=1 Tax=Lactobacillus sp. YT155 TaxID=3060955 RepID=UPI0026604459|nr:PD-(D/E)XK nuclease family protein [Lactobacillus sp. YT155]MDO1605441.1 PD-(D/E)XK nuclease family protein [Lactobacillus sp. YT155]